MNLTRIRFLILSFASIVPTVYAVDQVQIPEKEEDIPVEFVPTLNSAVTVGLHRLNSGPKVHFGNLGVVTMKSPDSTDYKYTKTYSNGTVTQDSLSAYEVDKNGNQMTANGQTRYTTGWISVVSVDPTTGASKVTVYTQVPRTQTDSSGNPIAYSTASGGTYYLPVTSTVVTTGADGSKTISDTTQTVWASTSAYLGYNANWTRSWSVQSTKQATFSQDSSGNNTSSVHFDSYGASSMGESKEAKSSGSTGFEVSMERTMGKIGKLEWGFFGGLQVQQVNAKSAGTVWAHLIDRRDVYQIVQTPYNKAFLQSIIGKTTYYDPYILDSSGNKSTVVAYGIDQPSSNTQSLSLRNLANGSQVYEYSDASYLTYASGGDQSIVLPLNVATMQATLYNGGTGTGTIAETGQAINYAGYLGEVLVHGFWQLKGAYYLMNIGPNFRYRFNDRWSIDGKIALSVAYLGVQFRADETFSDATDVYLYSTNAITSLVDNQAADETIYGTPDQNNTHRFLGGIYGEINAEYWVTERTGFYAGATYSSIRSLNANTLNGRTATINLGDNTGWHIGIITRF